MSLTNSRGRPSRLRLNLRWESRSISPTNFTSRANFILMEFSSGSILTDIELSNDSSVATNTKGKRMTLSSLTYMILFRSMIPVKQEILSICPLKIRFFSAIFPFIWDFCSGAFYGFLGGVHPGYPAHVTSLPTFAITPEDSSTLSASYTRLLMFLSSVVSSSPSDAYMSAMSSSLTSLYVVIYFS